MTDDVEWKMPHEGGPHPRELLDAVALQHLPLAVPQPRGQRARLPARQPLVHAAQRRALHVLQLFTGLGLDLGVRVKGLGFRG